MIHPEALKRAQQKANVASRFQMDAGVYDRALIAAYLSDPAVVEAVAQTGVRMGLASPEQVLQAIGAEVQR